MGIALNRMPWAAKDSVLHRPAEIAEVSCMTKEERVKYDSALRHYRDTLNVMRGEREKGVAEGMAKGMAEGVRATNLKNAAAMKALGLDADAIAKVTDLSAEEIAAL